MTIMNEAQIVYRSPCRKYDRQDLLSVTRDRECSQRPLRITAPAATYFRTEAQATLIVFRYRAEHALSTPPAPRNQSCNR